MRTAPDRTIEVRFEFARVELLRPDGTVDDVGATAGHYASSGAECTPEKLGTGMASSSHTVTPNASGLLLAANAR